MSFVDTNFWSATETEFYVLLQSLVSSLRCNDEDTNHLVEWRKTLLNKAIYIFDQYALSDLNEDGDLKRVVLARNGKNGLLHKLNTSKALKALTT